MEHHEPLLAYLSAFIPLFLIDPFTLNPPILSLEDDMQEYHPFPDRNFPMRIQCTPYGLPYVSWNVNLVHTYSIFTRPIDYDEVIILRRNH